MSENGALVEVPPATPAVVKDKPITINAAKEAIKEAKMDRLCPTIIRATAKVGRFIEQQGEHHLARAYLTNAIIEFGDDQRDCEKKAREALQAGDDEEYLKWLKIAATFREQVAKIAMNLNGTRRKVDPGEAPMPNVPTMPARTVITNNTQINMHPKPEGDLGHTT